MSEKKRKRHESDSDSGRDKKKHKSKSRHKEEKIIDLPRDVVTEIFKHLSDIDLVRSGRVSRVWLLASRSEMQRFQIKYLDRLKQTVLPTKKLSNKGIDRAIKYAAAEIRKAKEDVAAATKRIDSLVQMKFRKRKFKSMSITEQFQWWSNKDIPKKDYDTCISIQPPGERDYFYEVNTPQCYEQVDLEEIASFLQEGVDFVDDPNKAEKYYKVLMSLNFGSCTWNS